jgi:glycerol-3-phosphate O-acyltransferase
MRKELEMEQALERRNDDALKAEFGPYTRSLGRRWFESVRFAPEHEAELRSLHERGFVVHVMRTTAWVNFLYLTWALIRRGLPPVRAVVNLTPWLFRPWRNTAQRGEFDVRFTYARRNGGSGLIFLKRSAIGRAHGRDMKEDPFPALVSMARKGDKPVFLVPELFVWEKWSPRLKPSLVDRIFGSPEAPGIVHTLLAFWRNHKRAQFRVGEPIDLRKFIEDNPSDSDEVIARKVRGSLHHHLARETRAVFGPPFKPADRVIEEILRDRGFKKSLEETAQKTSRKPDSVLREARKDLNEIAARFTPTAVALVAPILHWVFNRIYDGIEVDEAGLERALKMGAKAPIVLCPSHKSHVDYLIMSYVLWSRGYSVPLVAAGANLSFFPLGALLRRAGAFFLRRSFKDDKVYGAAFKAYIKKLVRDGSHQEFFPEGGRSRTGKLLPAKLGMFTWQVDAVLDGARDDLYFVPVSIDYEKIVEGGSYKAELAGGEKKPEDLKALLSAPKVLASRYGRIHLSFDEPVSLAEFMKRRGVDPKAEVGDEQKKSLVRALGHRVMYGISHVSTVTPPALVASSLLAHRRRGITAPELAQRIGVLRRIAEEQGSRLSTLLRGAPNDPLVDGPIREAIKTFRDDGLITTEAAKGEEIYSAQDARRAELSFYKNTLMNLVAPRALVASALLASPDANRVEQVKERALFLSRLFKVEFIYRVGASFDTIFSETVDALVGQGLLARDGERIAIGTAPQCRPEVEFLADLLRDFLESYLIAALALKDLEAGPLDRKGFVKSVLETGRAEFLSGRIGTAESLSRPTLENAVAYFLDQKIVVEADKKLSLGPAAQTAEQRERLVVDLRTYLNRRRG